MNIPFRIGVVLMFASLLYYSYLGAQQIHTRIMAATVEH